MGSPVYERRKIQSASSLPIRGQKPLPGTCHVNGHANEFAAFNSFESIAVLASKISPSKSGAILEKIQWFEIVFLPHINQLHSRRSTVANSSGKKGLSRRPQPRATELPGPPPFSFPKLDNVDICQLLGQLFHTSLDEAARRSSECDESWVMTHIQPGTIDFAVCKRREIIPVIGSSTSVHSILEVSCEKDV
ncbi:hypothetical protein I7I51_04661 [Histoplasma capsulatum]|uniref:Uncharacterized protein n=1 Tax=Ajellomyces capsulatus TaxID=5037 RepID=A0A8A1M2P3_AJECA|nr:hypothetical protein I7I51_04661 [Histoplasma capsulatum]